MHSAAQKIGVMSHTVKFKYDIYVFDNPDPATLKEVKIAFRNKKVIRRIY
jgi:hypothetical protein